MAFELWNESYERTLIQGHIQHALVRTYRGEVTTNLALTCNDASLPAIGSSVIIGGDTYWAVTHRARYFNNTNARDWAFVDVIYDNDAGRFMRNSSGQPTTDPEQIAPYVQVQYAEHVQEVTNAKLVRIENHLGQSMQIPPYLLLSTTTAGPVMNSAGKVISNAQQRKHHKIITYWTYKRTWTSSWEDYIDDVNSAAFTVTQSDSYGTRLQYSIAAKEARLADIIKEDHWFGDKLYFRRGLVIETNPDTWEQRFPDQGHEGAIFGPGANAQYHWDEWPQTQWTQAELDALVPGGWGYPNGNAVRWETFTNAGDDESPLTEPTPLNGWGAPIGTARPGTTAIGEHQRHTMIYTTDDLTDWATALGVS